MHQQNTTDALSLILGRVVDVAPRLELPGVHAEISQLPHVGIGHDLERQRREGLLIIGLPVALVLLGQLRLGLGQATERLGLDALDRGHVHRRWQVTHHRVEQGLHALVLERRATQHGHDRKLQRRLSDPGVKLLGGDLFTLEELHHDPLVRVRHGLHEQLPGELRVLEQLLRNLAAIKRRPERLLVPDHRLHRHQVDDPLELVLDANGKLQPDRARLEAIGDHLHAVVKVCAHAIHLVHERHARDLVAVGLTPDRLRLRLHASHRVKDRDGAVEHAQRTLHLHREVDVTRGVDDVDAVVLILHIPETGRRRTRDRDPTLALLLHPVHLGRAVMNLTDLVRLPRVVEDALGGRRLARIDVGHDADVSHSLEWCCPRHTILSFLL